MKLPTFIVAFLFFHFATIRSCVNAEPSTTCSGVNFSLWDAENNVLLSAIDDGANFCVNDGQFAIEAHPQGCSEDLVGQVVISVQALPVRNYPGAFRSTQFMERRAPYFSFGDRKQGSFINGRNRTAESFIVAANIYDQSGEQIGSDSASFLFSEFNCSPCASTEAELQLLLDLAKPGYTVLICEGTTIETSQPLAANVDSLTLACDGGIDCVIRSQNDQANMLVKAESFTAKGISFFDGYGFAKGGKNLEIIGFGDHRISNCKFVGSEYGYNLQVSAERTYYVEIEPLGGSVKIEDCRFLNAIGRDIKSAEISGFDEVSVTRSSFDGNADHLRISTSWRSYQGSLTTIEDSTFTNATRSSVFISRYNNVVVTRSDFSDNVGNGLGLIGSQGFDDNPKSFTIEDCSFLSNSGAAFGGGLFVTFGPGTYRNIYELTLLNNVFENNTATSWGGAVYAPGIYHRPGILDKRFKLTLAGNIASGNNAETCDDYYGSDRLGDGYQCIALEDDLSP